MGNRSTLVPIVDFAFLYTTDLYYVGFQLNQAYAGGKPNPNGDFPLVSHFDVMGGYIFVLPNENWFIRPSTLIRWDSKTTPQFDVNFSALYKEKIWLGAGVRTGFEAVFFTEYNISKSFRIGYSYDLSFGAKAIRAGGSHEVFLGYNIPMRSKKLPSIRFF